MLILSVDTALQRCSAAILRDGDVLSVEIEDREKGHAERIAPMTAAAFKEAGVAPTDLDRIGVVIGPGGFTGVRVALSFARAMGLATGADIVGVTSLEALANAASVDGADVASVIDARRGQVYAGLYRNGVCIVAPFVEAPAAAQARLAEAASEKVLVVGTGASLMPPYAGWTAAPVDAQIDPVVVAKLAAAAPKPAGPPAPLYLRSPDAKPAVAQPIAAKPPRKWQPRK